MHIALVTLFPEYFQGPLETGLMQRAVEKKVVKFSFHNPRDKTLDNYSTVDDRPYGGGPGMLMLPSPLADTLDELGFEANKKAPTGQRLIYLSPKGKPLTQELARELATEKKISLICGRYEGIDSRIEELYPVERISVGDYILNGGESAAMCLIESISRLLPGFMGHEDSHSEESFSENLLEYPQYTRPETYGGLEVPEVLRSGNHGEIDKYRRQESLSETLKLRPDLLEKVQLNQTDREYLKTLPLTRSGRNLYCGLVHYPVHDKNKKTIAVSLTNLDIHDIGRSSYTYSLGACFIINPLKDQLSLLDEILNHWTKGPGGRSNPDRNAALSRVMGLESIEDAVKEIKKSTGTNPLIYGTTAVFKDNQGKKKNFPQWIGLQEIKEKLETKPVLLLFGTSHGLSTEAAEMCHGFLPPLRWHGDYNHLSVRAACAIIFDRILGDWL